MKNSLLLGVLVLGLCGSVTLLTVAKNEDGFNPVFDGKTLDGWTAADMSYWSIEDDAITGKITPEHPLKSNLYLIWKGGELADFELKMKSRITNPAKNTNSGFQFRSRELPNHDVAGYQMDNQQGSQFLVRLYDEHGRHNLALRGERTVFDENGKVAKEKIEEAAAPADFTLEDWHEYDLICVGTKLTLKVNGKLMAETTDNDPKNLDLQGILGLQLHSGGPTKVQFKDIQLKILKPGRQQVTTQVSAVPADEMVLNYHLMHPGGDSLPGDPNAAFYLDGTCHLHYILAHPWKDKKSFSFVHVTSPDMLHWTWQTTKLQPSFTGHGMFSGTGFITKEGKPAAIYHGQASGKNQIAIAKDNKLTEWEKPYPVDVRNADGTELKMGHWDPDCWLIGDTYYAISGGQNPPLLKSKDLKTWTRVGDFLRNDLPDVAIGEDISCANFFKIDNKWILLCISHPLGCRYYIGDWDEKAEQFVPEKHGRMNWRRENQSIFGTASWRVDFFAPESVLTPDGRRVMWAWLATVNQDDGKMNRLTIQSLPRELSLPADGILRIKPLRELESLRFDPVTLSDIKIKVAKNQVPASGCPAGQKIADLGGEAVEICISIPREEAVRKLFGFTLFSDGKGGGLPIMFRPENGTLRVGMAEAPFSVAGLPAGEDIDLRIFVDRYLVEVFVNDRQAMVAFDLNYKGKSELQAFTVGNPTAIKKLEIWKLKPTNQGFFEAQKNRIWEPQIN